MCVFVSVHSPLPSLSSFCPPLVVTINVCVLVSYCVWLCFFSFACMFLIIPFGDYSFCWFRYHLVLCVRGCLCLCWLLFGPFFECVLLFALVMWLLSWCNVRISQEWLILCAKPRDMISSSQKLSKAAQTLSTAPAVTPASKVNNLHGIWKRFSLIVVFNASVNTWMSCSSSSGTGCEVSVRL